MSNYEMQDGSWVLFKNEDKQKDNQPDYKGKIKVNGEEQQLAGWIKESKNGKKYISGKFSPYQNRTQESKQYINNNAHNPQQNETVMFGGDAPKESFDNDIPF